MRARIALICSLTVAGLVALLGTPAHAGTTFVVNNTAASGAGSLHDAILGSNALKSVDTIDFAIATSGVQTITSPLLAITDPVVIDGTTEPGYAVGFPTVWIVGSGSGVGLEVDASGSTIKGLGIGGFFEGIQLSGGNDTVVGSVFGGASPTGGLIEPNTVGVAVLSSDNTIGGTTPADRNIVSANNLGIEVTHGPGVDRNTIQGNYVGTDASGTSSIGNDYGIVVVGASDRTSITGNVVSGNTFSGIELSNCEPGEGVDLGACPPPSQRPSRTSIALNMVGVDATGMMALGNGFGGFGGAPGVEVNSADRTIIGGPLVPKQNNFISGNSGPGVELFDTAWSQVSGNTIGTDASRTVALPNGASGGRGGVVVANSTHAVVGGYMLGSKKIVGASNLIAGNTGNGLTVSNSPRIRVSANLIGGTDGLGNSEMGIAMFTTDNSLVDQNVIDGNGAAGIYLGSGVENTFSQNSIVANGGLGIDLDPSGVTPNDPLDPDMGPNDLQNFPDIQTVSLTGTQLTVSGTLNSLANSFPVGFVIELFANHACDASGNGEGEVYLGSTTVTTDAAGNAAFSVSFPVPFSDPKITATATLVGLLIPGTGDTSEFSNCKGQG